MSPAPPVNDATLETLLDNPYWGALCTTQSDYAIGSSLAKRFPADVIPFAGLANKGPEALAALHALLAPGESIFVTSPHPLDSQQFQELRQLPGLQMAHPPGTRILDPSDGSVADAPVIQELGPQDIPEMLALKAIAFPGYFGPRAASLGKFFGIRAPRSANNQGGSNNPGELVAMAGERLKLAGMCEISAVCTHPQHVGKGYAAALIQHLLRVHAAEGTESFLQVVNANTRAIALYQRLGFIPTRPITWRQIQRIEP
jgi:ribosomal protein S18 acetylase RimI-like enzyme